jgi:hypothetical protein
MLAYQLSPELAEYSIIGIAGQCVKENCSIMKLGRALAMGFLAGILEA